MRNGLRSLSVSHFQDIRLDLLSPRAEQDDLMTVNTSAIEHKDSTSREGSPSETTKDSGPEPVFIARMLSSPPGTETTRREMDNNIPSRFIRWIQSTTIDKQGRYSSCRHHLIHSVRVDEELDLDLVETIAEHNGHPQWREQVQFLKNFCRQKWFSISRSTIDQVVQQEWFGAG